MICCRARSPNSIRSSFDIFIAQMIAFAIAWQSFVGTRKPFSPEHIKSRGPVLQSVEMHTNLLAIASASAFGIPSKFDDIRNISAFEYSSSICELRPIRSILSSSPFSLIYFFSFSL